MADNTELYLGSGGDIMRTDELSPGLKVQVVKLATGPSGTEDARVEEIAPLPVRSVGNTSVCKRHTATTGSTVLSAARPGRVSITIVNRGAVDVHYNLGVTAVVANHPKLGPGEGITLPTTQSVNVITPSVTALCDVTEIYNV